MSDDTNCKTGKTFRNWAHTIQFHPATYCHPHTVKSVADIVDAAAGKQQHVRIQGNGHSWSQFVQTNDHLIQLDELKLGDLGDGVAVDATTQRARVFAGVRLQDLVDKLRTPHHLALINTGSILRQSIAGAISTGTHGTGISLGNLATQITGMKVMTIQQGHPSELELTEGDDVLNAARVSLGALGIITEVTIQCRPDYDVELKGYGARFDDIINQAVIDELNHTNERLRLWWLHPAIGKTEVIVTTMNETTKPRTSLLDDIFSLVDGLADGTKDHPVIFRHQYDRMLTVPVLHFLHRECEYAIPIERTAEALRSLKAIIDEGDFTTALPIEVRFVKGDDAWLSPANGRDVCYIGVNTTASNTNPSANELFARFEPLMKELGGRPHWGKHFTLTPRELETMYPDGYQRFRELRTTFDPDGVFTNTLLQNLFV